MPAAPQHDPNWPSDLRIAPSSSKSIQLGGVADDAASDDAAQDIEGFGIAGRTWEAAYASRVYMSPPQPGVEYSPPCPLYTPSANAKSHRTLVEIGSGTGYLSLALAPHLPPTTTLVMTDLDSVCPLLSRNLSEAQTRWRSTINSTALPTVRVEPLPWGDDEALRNLSLMQPRANEDDDPDAVTILASDLVYFPFLYPPLLRTLLGLTTPRRPGAPSPKVLFAYKVRSLVREQPFWSAFGRWFNMESVATRATKAPKPTQWTRFGEADDIYIFLCTRRPSTYDQPIPTDDEHLMRGAPGDATSADSQFELLLMGDLFSPDDDE